MTRALTDFHSHILPGVDDGSKTVAESIAMLRREAEQGVDWVIATPHFYARYDRPDRFLARREEAAAVLRQAMAEYPGLPKVELGAEVHYFLGMSDSEVLAQLTIDGTRCILIEMPPPPWTESMYREMEWIYTKQNLLPLIAHVDRYIRPLRPHGIPRRLAELPVMVQANAEFFLQKSTQGLALRLLREDRIHVLGSDCHNLKDRTPNLADAVQVICRHCGHGIIDRIRNHEQEILTVK